MIRINFTGLLIAVLLAGCGGDGKGEANKPPAASPQAVAEAKSAARNAIAQVESCYTDTQDYSQCKDLSDSGLDVGTGPGQVRVTSATWSGYRIEAYVEGGTFAVVKTGGTIKRTCNGSGCEGGTW